MEDLVPFASREYFLLLLLLIFSRGMDMFSTRVATPNLVLEGNPVAKALGWTWGVPFNIALCFPLAFNWFAAIVWSTISLLVAARNFQSAWLMRSMGEEAYRDWHIARIQETPVTLFLLCLAGNTLLTAGVGLALIFFSGGLLVPVAIGYGVIGYALAVGAFTLLAVWRLRRAEDRHRRRETPNALVPGTLISTNLVLPESCACGDPKCSHK